MTRLTPISGTVKEYAWGAAGGIADALGQRSTGAPEAELWLGAHPGAPSRPADPADGGWPDLAAWERESGQRLPYLLKLLAVGAPLSVQAHPGAEQARSGHHREQAAGVPAEDRARTYRDPYGKPELLIAVEDGFDGMSGFRPPAETLDLLELVASQTEEESQGVGLRHWQHLLGDAPDATSAIRDAVSWLLSGDPRVASVVQALSSADLRPRPEHDLVALLARHHPGDPGIALALMLNRVRLDAGEALWIPPGQVHCYLSGVGVELMGPSDTVLRGGLTDKHVDVAELLQVLVFTPGPAPRLLPVEVGPGASAYRPRTVPSGADVPFELVHVRGDAELVTGTPSIALVLQGGFAVTVDGDTRELTRGQACIADGAGTWSLRGRGSLYLATTLTG